MTRSQSWRTVQSSSVKDDRSPATPPRPRSSRCRGPSCRSGGTGSAVGCVLRQCELGLVTVALVNHDQLEGEVVVAQHRVNRHRRRRPGCGCRSLRRCPRVHPRSATCRRRPVATPSWLRGELERARLDGHPKRSDESHHQVTGLAKASGTTGVQQPESGRRNDDTNSYARTRVVAQRRARRYLP